MSGVDPRPTGEAWRVTTYVAPVAHRCPWGQECPPARPTAAEEVLHDHDPEVEGCNPATCPAYRARIAAVDVDALEAARAAATPGPWATDGACVVPGYWGDTPPILARTNDYPDAALIVAAVNNLDELLAAARERDALRAAVEGLAEGHRRWAVTNRDLADRMDGSDVDFHTGMAQAQEASCTRIHALLADVDGGGR